MRVHFLGTATSYGVPQVGCQCATCTSTDPRNFRLRASVYVESDEGTAFVIDTGPEVRLQLLRAKVSRADAVLYTHYHADHTGGIDDLKAFNMASQEALPCYGNAATFESLRQRFAYAFEGTPWVGYIPHITYTVIDREPFQVGPTCVQPIPLQHGRITATGYRIGDFAYLCDTNGVPPESLPLLQNLDTLVVDTLRWDTHPTHFSVPETLALVEELSPRRAVLTHVSHHLEHEETSQRLPPGVSIAYDGLELVL